MGFWGRNRLKLLDFSPPPLARGRARRGGLVGVAKSARDPKVRIEAFHGPNLKSSENQAKIKLKSSENQQSLAISKLFDLNHSPFGCTHHEPQFIIPSCFQIQRGRDAHWFFSIMSSGLSAMLYGGEAGRDGLRHVGHVRFKWCS
jgi:hypothetical protein